MSFICSLCPRKCNVLRTDSAPAGYCHSPALPVITRAAPHFGEEPCLSGSNGAGAVFFSGCNLRCVFCQNFEISRRGGIGKVFDADHLAELMLRLQETGVHNIDLVTPTHYSNTIAEALEKAHLKIPVVWNSSGYESAETLKRLEGLVQIYMPDLKYLDSVPAGKYSAAPDYPEIVCAAIKEMFRQRGPFVMDSNGILQSGLLIRHLILPDNVYDSMSVIDFIAETFPPDSILFSLMSQYTPMRHIDSMPELNRTIDSSTAEHLIRYMERCGIQNGYTQELGSSGTEQIPAFDLTGL